ncbi:MAG: SDR family oxidoreductase, partial [Patescibacteria group bacterium]
HFVTGATGFVGRHLVKALLGSGEHVWVVVRDSRDMTAKEKVMGIFGDHLHGKSARLKVLKGDILKKDLGLSHSDISTLKKHSVSVWHLAANLSFLTADKTSVQKTNFNGTENTLSIAQRVAQNFFYVSTAYVCGNATSFTESELNKSQDFHNQYEISKFQAEKYIRKNCSIPYLIFRPSIIIGDAHKGKSEGCSFGYYRYMFVFHFLKTQIVKTLLKKSILGLFLRKTGTKYDTKKGTLTVPALFMPYPKKATIDLVTVDYVVSSMIKLSHSNTRRIAIHLTQKSLPDFSFLLKSALYDLGYRDIKFIPVPSWLFRAILRLLYFVGVPVRKYIRSVMWYTPYITKHCYFNHNLAIHSMLEKPPRITRTLIKNINSHARKDLLSDSKL